MRCIDEWEDTIKMAVFGEKMKILIGRYIEEGKLKRKDQFND